MERQVAVLNTSLGSGYPHHCCWEGQSLELTPVWEQTTPYNRPRKFMKNGLEWKNPVVLQKLDKSVLEEECQATLAGVPMPST